MELFEQISEIFELKTLNFQKQTKKTLLHWAKRVKFEKRREKFFESCGEGKILSKVSICKSKDRPEWTNPLEGQKVKDIRKSIKNFLSVLGLLKIQGTEKKKIESLAKERNWEAVITLSKDSFEDSHEKRGSGDHSDSDELKDETYRRTQNESSKTQAEWEKAFQHQRAHMSEQDYLIRELIKAQDAKLPALEAISRSQSPTKPDSRKRSPSPKKRKPSPKRKSPPPSPLGPAGGGGMKDELPRIPVLNVPYRSNCVLYDPDEVNCDPDNLSKMKLFRKHQQR